MNLLSKGDGGIVVGDLTRGRAVAASERNAVVDVENSRLSTGRPDYRGGGDLILLGVYLPINPCISASDGCLSRGLRRISHYMEYILQGILTVAAASCEKK